MRIVNDGTDIFGFQGENVREEKIISDFFELLRPNGLDDRLNHEEHMKKVYEWAELKKRINR